MNSDTYGVAAVLWVKSSGFQSHRVRVRTVLARVVANLNFESSTMIVLYSRKLLLMALRCLPCTAPSSVAPPTCGQRWFSRRCRDLGGEGIAFRRNRGRSKGVRTRSRPLLLPRCCCCCCCCSSSCFSCCCCCATTATSHRSRRHLCRLSADDSNAQVGYRDEVLFRLDNHTNVFALAQERNKEGEKAVPNLWLQHR